MLVIRALAAAGLRLRGCGTGRNAKGGIRLAKTVQAAILQHRCVAGQKGVAHVAEDDFTVAQAGSHLAVGVDATVRSGRTGVFAADAGDSIGDDASTLPEMAFRVQALFRQR